MWIPLRIDVPKASTPKFSVCNAHPNTQIRGARDIAFAGMFMTISFDNPSLFVIEIFKSKRSPVRRGVPRDTVQAQLDVLIAAIV